MHFITPEEEASLKDGKNPKKIKTLEKLKIGARTIPVNPDIVLQKEPEDVCKANNAFFFIEEIAPEYASSKPFPPVGKRPNNRKKVEIPDDKLNESIGFDKEEDRELITDILSMRTKMRGPKEIAFLQKAFKKVQFFDRIQGEVDEISYNRIFQTLTLETFELGGRVFNINDIGRKFYIIIKGSVYILLPSNGALESERSLKKKLDPSVENLDEKKLESTESLSDIMSTNLSNQEKTGAIMKFYPGFWIVRTMVEGESFGEIALNRNSDGKRTATVVCKEKTMLGVLTYGDYHNVLGNLYERKYREKIEFLSGIDIFAHWNDSQLSSIILNLEEMRFRRKAVIFKEGDQADRIYFIKNGEVELQKSLCEKEEKYDKPERQFNLSRSSSHFVLRNGTSLTVRTKTAKFQEPVKIGILTEKSYFGDSELLVSKPREYTAIAYSSHVVLFSMTRQVFLHIVKDEESLKYLQKHVNKKNLLQEEQTSKYLNRNLELLNRNNNETNDPHSFEATTPKFNFRAQKPNVPELLSSKYSSPTLSIPTHPSGFDMSKSAGFWDEGVQGTQHLERVYSQNKMNHTNSPSFRNSSPKLNPNYTPAQPSSPKQEAAHKFAIVRPPRKAPSQLYSERKKWIEQTLQKEREGDDDFDKILTTEIIDNSQDCFNFVRKGLPLNQSPKFEPLNPSSSHQVLKSKQPSPLPQLNYSDKPHRVTLTSLGSPKSVKKINTRIRKSRMTRSPLSPTPQYRSTQELYKDSPQIFNSPREIKKIIEETKQRPAVIWQDFKLDNDIILMRTGTNGRLSPKIQNLISSYRQISETVIGNVKKRR